jgi:hypothetical protein
LVPELNVGVLEAVISVSGSTEGGEEFVSETAASPDLIERIGAARTRNPHFSPVGNGRFPVTGSGQPVVGCTIPKIPVSVDGLDRVYREQANPLWRAGIERMDWMFGPTGFRKSDLYSQLNWTLTPGVPAVSGSWVEWPWPYTAVDYNAYRSDVSASLAKWQQPSADLVGEDPLAQNRKRTEGFLREITDIVNRINADSNIIRGLQILGGNVRINQQPRREVRFDTAYVQPRPNIGVVSGGPTGAVFVDGREVSTVNIPPRPASN